MKQLQSPSLTLLMEMFPGQINIDLLSAARVLGLSAQTAHNLSAAKKFPVKTFHLGKRRLGCSIIDLAATLEAQHGKRRPGRPTNAERSTQQSASQ